MSWRRFLSRMRGLRARGRRDADLRDEIASHLAILEDELRDDGYAPEEARRIAARTFGGALRAREASHDAWGFRWLDDLIRDVQFGVRMLWRDRAVSLVVISILAVAVGASTAIYSLVNTSLVHIHDIPVLDRWVAVRAYLPERRAFSNFFSVPELNDISRLTDVFEGVGAVSGTSFTLSDGDFPEPVQGTFVTASVWPMLGVAPEIGRTFFADEDRPGGPDVVVLSHEFWRDRFNASPGVLGSTITLDGRPHTIIGVMPPHYGLWGGRLWIPFHLDRTSTDRGARWFWVIGVTRQGLAPEQVNARLQALARVMARDHGLDQPQYRDMQLTEWNVREAVVAGVRPALLVLLGAVGLLMVLSATNVANLLFARAAVRRRELTVRAALGAGRLRLVRQMMTEGLLLSVTGGALGAALAVATLPLLVRLIPAVYLTTDADRIRVDAPAVWIATGLSVATGLLFGLLPAMPREGSGLSDRLRERTDAGRRTTGRVQRGLMVAEIALALVVTIGASLMIESYRAAARIALGFNSDGLWKCSIFLPVSKYPDATAMRAFYARTLDRIAALPGVDGAGAVSQLPLGYRAVDVTSFDFTIEGRPVADGRALRNASFRVVTPAYFSVLETPLLRGRVFTAADGADQAGVAVINETMARLYWGKADPVGERLQLLTRWGSREPQAPSGPREVTIVGVVKDSKQVRVIDAPIRQEIYLPQAQYALEARAMSIVVRSRLAPADLTAAIRTVVRSLDAGQPIFDVDVMSHVTADSFGPRRLTMLLLGFFAMVGLTLAAVGLYALVSFSVTERTAEIGIRLAIGARPTAILQMVLWDGARVAAAGIAVGLSAARASAGLVAGALYGVSATDPLAFAATAVLLLLVTALASAVPARRATRVDPLTALRSD